MTRDPGLSAVLRGLGNPRIAVVGDFMLDRYVWGDTSRVSPEAPVPVVQAHREEERPGGAGNVAANLCELDARVECFGVIGSDLQGGRLVAGLEALGAAGGGLLTLDGHTTTQKIRIMARSQQILRLDREEARPISEATARTLSERLAAAQWDAVVLSDYGKGVLSENVVAPVLEEARRRGAPSLVDPKHPDLSRYRGASLVTPNRAEAEAAWGGLLRDLPALATGGEALRQRAGLEALLITLGQEGMFLLRDGADPLHVPTAARAVFDVTGAGDTVLAALALALAEGCDWEVAVRLANAAAGLVVAKVGTATVGRSELLHFLNAATTFEKRLPPGCGPEILQKEASRLRREGLRLVFTNGCFDILHAGHVRFLQEARGLGDALVVGVNDDASVRRLKGADRPFNSLDDRMEVLAALECVDLVVAFAEDTPESLIRTLRPDVLVKGGDWREKGVVGAEFVRAQGGEVHLLDLLPGRSTSGLAQKIRGD